MMRLILAILGGLLLAGQVLAQTPTRKISNVAGDVYRFQNNFHFSLIVATSEGTIVVDPINSGASNWLKENLKTITDKPVTHLIYSHSHGDHASGGANLADGAQVIAHANAPETIDGVTPTLRIDDKHSFKLGGKQIELTYLGPGHGVDMIAVTVQPENVAFIVDVASPQRLVFRDFGGANVDDWINQIKKAESLDFKIFAPGHGRLGTKAELTEARAYIEDLRTQVLAGLKAGKTAEELSETLMMEKYKDWQQYEAWRALNVWGMGKYLMQQGLVN